MAKYLIETDKPIELHALLANHGIVPKRIIRIDTRQNEHRVAMKVQEAVLSWIDEKGNTGEETVFTRYNPDVVNALNEAMEATE